jgi:excisionase family DNA binding protein
VATNELQGREQEMDETGTSESDVLARRTFTVEEAARILGISRTTAYECVRSGELPSLRFRRRVVIPAHVIDELVPIGNVGTRGRAERAAF